MKRLITRSTEVLPTPRVKQASGLFDLPPSLRSQQAWDVECELPASWNVGVVVGPSGAGKSTVAKELFGEDLVGGWGWPDDKSILDGFPAGMGVKEICGLLSSVGFSSPPAWLRPFRVLSNGQQFRASLARTLAEKPGRAVVDEFGSFVHQQVRQVAAAAVAKAVRCRGGQFVAVLCHEDAVEYFEPDWVVEVQPGRPVRLKVVRGSVRRPSIELEIVRADRSAWDLFKPHHYLSSELHPGPKCFVGLVAGEPAAFTAVIPFPHAKRPGWREHRTVCLPDFQGVGVGNAMSEFVASLFVAKGRPYFSATSHPAMIRHRASRPDLWRMTRKPGLGSAHRGSRGDVRMRNVGSVDRLTAGFEYVGPARPQEARAFGVAA